MKQPGDFARAKAQGSAGLRLPHCQRGPASAGLRTAAWASSRASKIGNAVARSRARRLMRESFRLHQRELARPVDLVLVARPSIAGKELARSGTGFSPRRQTGAAGTNGSMNIVQRTFVLMIRFYQVDDFAGRGGVLGPAGRCRFTPSCSQYALEAIRLHGAVAAAAGGLRRLLPCHPWGACGDDPVPAAPGSANERRNRKIAMDRKSIVILGRGHRAAVPDVAARGPFFPAQTGSRHRPAELHQRRPR